MPKLTPEQERGVRLLNAAEAETAGLQPDMQAFVLWRASYAYTRLDAAKAAELSIKAFRATQAIDYPSDNNGCYSQGNAGDIKSWIQKRVLYDMIHAEQIERVEQLLPQATAPVRDEITSELVKYYQSKKDLTRAQDSLARLADSDNYPFGVAANLLVAMGPERSGDRMAIFNQALHNYELHSTNVGIGGEDIGTFIEHTWKEVPAGLVLEGINKVLDTAKDQQSPAQYSMTSASGSVVLKSGYDLRLFELLPVLQELDKDKADALLRERTEVAEQLKMHPQGLQSLGSESSASYSPSNIGAVANRQQVAALMQTRVEEIIQKADTDASGALGSARSLPVTFDSWSPRSKALLGIADKAAKKKPSVSRAALDEFSAIQDQLSPQEMNGIDMLPALYLKLGDVEGAQKGVKILVKAAQKLYEGDTDADDPNGAFKGTWPSTDLWRKAIQEAAKISPQLPEEVIAGLQDREISAYEKVVFATALIGAPATTSAILVGECRKEGSRYQVSF